MFTKRLNPVSLKFYSRNQLNQNLKFLNIYLPIMFRLESMFSSCSIIFNQTFYLDLIDSVRDNRLPQNAEILQ